jgi:hypothetical protein
VRTLLHGQGWPKCDVGRAGLFPDLPQNSLGEEFAGIHAPGGHLGAGLRVVPVIEDEQFPAAGNTSSDVRGHPDTGRLHSDVLPGVTVHAA